MSSVKETVQTKIAPREQLLRDLWDDGNVSVDGHIATDLEHWVPRFMKHGIDFVSNWTDKEYEEGLCGNEDYYMVFDPAIYKESAYCKVETEMEKCLAKCDHCGEKDIDPEDLGDSDKNLGNIGGGYAHERCMSEEQLKEYERTSLDLPDKDAQVSEAKKVFSEYYQLVKTPEGLLPNNPLPGQYWRLKENPDIVLFVEKLEYIALNEAETFKIFWSQENGKEYVSGYNGNGEKAILINHFMTNFEYMEKYEKCVRFNCGDDVKWVSNSHGVKPVGKIMSFESGGYKVQFPYGSPLANREYFYDDDLVSMDATAEVIKWKEHWAMVLAPEIEKRGITVKTKSDEERYLLFKTPVISDEERYLLFGMETVVEGKDGNLIRSSAGLSHLPLPDIESVTKANVTPYHWHCKFSQWITENVSPDFGEMYWVSYLAGRGKKKASSELEKERAEIETERAEIQKEKMEIQSVLMKKRAELEKKTAEIAALEKEEIQVMEAYLESKKLRLDIIGTDYIHEMYEIYQHIFPFLVR